MRIPVADGLSGAKLTRAERNRSACQRPTGVHGGCGLPAADVAGVADPRGSQFFAPVE